MIFTEPKKPAEAEIQAELFTYCKNEGLECHLEYTYKKCRFDMVVLRKGEIGVIVEVKSLNDYKLPDYTTHQIDKYKRFQVPLFIISNNRGLKKYAEYLRIFIDLSWEGEKYYNSEIYSRIYTALKFFSQAPKKRNKIVRRIHESGKVTKRANVQRMESRAI